MDLNIKDTETIKEINKVLLDKFSKLADNLDFDLNDDGNDYFEFTKVSKNSDIDELENMLKKEISKFSGPKKEMKEIVLTLKSDFEITNEIQTYGRDGSKHRVGSFEGTYYYTLNNILLFTKQKEKRRNPYSGRLDTFVIYDKREQDLIPSVVQKIFNEMIETNKYTKGKNYDKFVNELSRLIQERNWDAIKNLSKEQVINYKRIVIKVDVSTF